MKPVASALEPDAPDSPPLEMSELIIQAASQLFGQKGFEGVSTRDIAQRVGVRQAALYHHFASKQDLYDQVVRRANRYVNERVLGALAAAAGPEDKVREFFRAIVATFGDRTDQTLVVERELMDSGEEGTHFAPENIRPPHEALTAVVRELAPHAPAEQMAFFFFSLAYGARKLRSLQAHLRGLQAVQADEALCRALADCALDALRAYGSDRPDAFADLKDELDSVRRENAQLRDLVIRLSLQQQREGEPG